MDSLEEQGSEGQTDVSAITSEAKFAAEVLLAEYKTLRDEILKKMDHRTSMVVCSVTVSSAVLGFGVERANGPLLLVSPLVSLLLGTLIAFQNAQIGEASEHIRNEIEAPLLSAYAGYHGWHQVKRDPKYRLKQRLLPYHLPLILIAAAPAVVAIPLAVANAKPLILTLPILFVDLCLLAVYITQIVKLRDLL
ncbi:hypothetical protein [Amycolatopsis sp. DG1A-15b]|uniref:hypothetical protein n=1 Tax=Amycolatopsis sp. DG1A-15b TaxID=3052846 RepID=UPI00255C07E1|nr:hypothetical protein [Amycolatopsis sp. DG1A-15b]WIX89301.1 hypothetical protein QRY02_02285 [Amycolatopsis sp. DG1A-15b]